MVQPRVHAGGTTPQWQCYGKTFVVISVCSLAVFIALKVSFVPFVSPPNPPPTQIHARKRTHTEFRTHARTLTTQSETHNRIESQHPLPVGTPNLFSLCAMLHSLLLALSPRRIPSMLLSVGFSRGPAAQRRSGLRRFHVRTAAGLGEFPSQQQRLASQRSSFSRRGRKGGSRGAEAGARCATKPSPSLFPLLSI